MRRTTTVLSLAALLLPTLAFSAPPADPTGSWLVSDGSFALDVYPCGENFCGRIIWADAEPAMGDTPLDSQNRDPQLRERTLLGLEVLTGLAAVSDESGEWREGSFYDPREGKTFYRAAVRADEDGGMILVGYPDIERRGRMIRSRFSHTVHFTPTSPEALAAR